ncbi:DUF485 domain-containing protein [Streptomyces sp. NPDC005329]|uniref:DUF485 domain-containing protein n=1 Tax=Streptomyces sp. NPDC005329 TaxID=3157034 RepID=UPI0033B004FE
MTYADENRYPPSAPTGRPLPHTEPRTYDHDVPRHDFHGTTYGNSHGTAYGNAYGTSYGNAYGNSYGQAPWDEPHRHESPRHSGDLAALRSAYRRLRRTATLAALGSFMVYVLLSCYAPALMGATIVGELSLGMALGVFQLVVTFAAVFWYGRGAQRSVDPLARAVRERAVPTGRNAGVAR